MWEYESGRKPRGQAEVIADLTLNEGVTLKRSWDKMTDSKGPFNHYILPFKTVSVFLWIIFLLTKAYRYEH